MRVRRFDVRHGFRVSAVLVFYSGACEMLTMLTREHDERG